MNVVIPMAGKGSRFGEAGYTVPKPLIDINGSPMIVKALSTLDVDAHYHFIIRDDMFKEEIIRAVESVIPKSSFIVIDYVTEGPASSVLLFEEAIDNDEELIVANCDQVMWWNSKTFLHNVRLYDAAVVTYFSETPKNSYAKLDMKGYVTEVKEKRVISNIGLNGIHYWKKGAYFVASAKKMMEVDDRAPNGEFYVGPAYNYLKELGLKTGIYHIPNEQHHAVGTPEDLAKFVEIEKQYYENL